MFKAKKILFLGASQFHLPAIKVAQKLGVRVIVADNEPKNIAHQVADFSEIISTDDYKSLVALARKYNVDGVMTYGPDTSTPSVSYIAEKLNLPGNPYASSLLLQRKDAFRKFQKQMGLPHPEFSIIERDTNTDNLKMDLSYPLIIKPTDSAGSRGQTIISDLSQLKKAVDKARKFSSNGVVVCEEFLRSDYLELDGDVLIQDGALSFAQYGHNYFSEKNKYNVPIGEIMPGFISTALERKIDLEFKKIIKKLNLKSGCLNFDALIIKDELVIIDIGLRNGGNYVPELIRISTGVDLTEAAVYCALGIKYPIKALHAKNPKPVMTYILNSDCQGQFSGIRYEPDIVNNIIKSVNFVEYESEVEPFISGDKALGVVFLEFASMSEMLEKWAKVEDLINVDIIPIRRKGNDVNKIEQSVYKRYNEKISPFLQKKIHTARLEKNENVLRVLSSQFVFNNNETDISDKETTKHYNASADFTYEGEKLFGVERLYRRQIVVDITLKCMAHCRFCLRRNYDPFILSNDDLSRIARFIGISTTTEEIREILITGGDPFLVPLKLKHFLNELSKYAPFIEVVRIASRLPIHQPDLINDNILSVLKQDYIFRIEMATQINHSIELFSEVKEAFRKIKKVVSVIYNQTVLLNGINNSTAELIELYDNLRTLGIENHYLFHCVPIGGLNWLRTTIDETIELANSITSSGFVSGRVKPQVALMTDIGKITLFDKSIIKREGNKILLSSNYYLKDRLKWNPSWEIPQSAEINADGRMNVWYHDKKL